jgi:hypothetical protein
MEEKAMNRKNLITIAATILLCGLSMTMPAKADWFNPATWGGGLDAIGNAVQAVYMFFYDAGFVLTATVLFILFFAIEIGLIYLYWRIGASLYNTIIPAVKRVQEML